LFVTQRVSRVVVIKVTDTADMVPAATNPTQVATKKKKSSTKKPRNKAVHPRTSEMVRNAIISLKDRGGSSLQAIKKFIAANYAVDLDKMSPYLKRYIKRAVSSGELLQTRGKGASGSFRLAPAKTGKAPVPTAPARATSAPKETKARKRAALKSAEKKRADPAKAKKSPSKVKMTTKVPTKKPKAPRPKTAAKPKAPKKKSPKKK